MKRVLLIGGIYDGEWRQVDDKYQPIWVTALERLRAPLGYSSPEVAVPDAKVGYYNPQKFHFGNSSMPIVIYVAEGLTALDAFRMLVTRYALTSQGPPDAKS